LLERGGVTTAVKDTIVTAATTKRYQTKESTVSTNDTVTMEQITTLLGASVMKKSDGSAVTATIATNVVTITGASLTDVPVIVTGYGTP
jgi:hypothetical protein